VANREADLMAVTSSSTAASRSLRTHCAASTADWCSLFKTATRAAACKVRLGVMSVMMTKMMIIMIGVIIVIIMTVITKIMTRNIKIIIMIMSMMLMMI
jgi:hypothetical protein